MFYLIILSAEPAGEPFTVNIKIIIKHAVSITVCASITTCGVNNGRNVNNGVKQSV